MKKNDRWAFILLVITIIVLAYELINAANADSKCGGVERWPVKTLQDGFKPGTPQSTTIEGLIGLTPPAHWSRSLPRQTSERLTVTLKCKIVAVGVEADSDFHLVLSDGKHTMIGEIPKPECADPDYSKQFAACRACVVKAIGYYPKSIRMLKSPVTCTLTGVVFFDMPHHNGKGHAGNEVEIHPIIKIQ
ncbi:hypothetical protein KGP36_01555 [Patescibacteria group bacterium]|nr:hypothetical protein [Patescibacteria group bacterium]